MDAHVCSGPPEPSAPTNGFKRPYPIVGRSVDEGQLFAMSVKGSRRSIRADIHPTQGSSVAPLPQGRTVAYARSPVDFCAAVWVARPSATDPGQGNPVRWTWDDD